MSDVVTAWFGRVYITEDPKQSTVRYGVYLCELRHARTRGAFDVRLPDRGGGANLRPWGPRGAWIWTGVERGRADGQGP